MPRPGRPALLCDLDGTLIHAKGDDLETARLDLALVGVIEALQFARGWKLIVLSERGERQRDDITALLSTVGLSVSKLILRDVGDARTAPAYKRYAFDFLISPAYDIRLVFEDDPAVARSFRALGLPCFLVSEWAGVDDFSPRATTPRKVSAAL